MPSSCALSNHMLWIHHACMPQHPSTCSPPKCCVHSLNKGYAWHLTLESWRVRLFWISPRPAATRSAPAPGQALHEHIRTFWHLMSRLVVIEWPSLHFNLAGCSEHMHVCTLICRKCTCDTHSMQFTGDESAAYAIRSSGPPEVPVRGSWGPTNPA